MSDTDTDLNNKEEELKQHIETDFFHLYFNISRTSDFSLHFNNLYSFLLTLYNYKTEYKDTVFYYVNLYNFECSNRFKIFRKVFKI